MTDKAPGVRTSNREGASIYDNSFVAFHAVPNHTNSLLPVTSDHSQTHTNSHNVAFTSPGAFYDSGSMAFLNQHVENHSSSAEFPNNQWNSSAPDLLEMSGGCPQEKYPVSKGTNWQERLRELEVSLLVIGLAFIATSQALVTKKTGYVMHRYPYTVLLVVSFCFVPIFFIMVLFIRWRSGGFSPHTTTRSLHTKFCVVGILNALNGMCVIFANPHVAGSLQQIMVQMVMPITMVMSIVVLRSSFQRLQIIGSLLIVIGVVIELYPQFTLSGRLVLTSGAGGDEFTCDEHTSSGAYKTHDTAPDYFWPLVFLLGQIPMGMQSVYQELAFSQAHVNVVYMIAWSSLAQFVSLCVLSVLNFIPKFGAVPPAEFFSYMQESLECACGHLEGCEEAPIMLALFVCVMLVAQIVQALLVKRSSAALVVIVLTVVTPLSTVSFSIPYFMGDHTEALKLSTCLALAVLTVGVMIYRIPDAITLNHARSRGATMDALNEFGTEDVGRPFFSTSSLRRESEPLLREKRLRSYTTTSDHHPVMLNSRIGVISSEYTGEADFLDGVRTILYGHTRLTDAENDIH
eukprot:CFRG3710T1